MIDIEKSDVSLATKMLNFQVDEDFQPIENFTDENSSLINQFEQEINLMESNRSDLSIQESSNSLNLSVVKEDKTEIALANHSGVFSDKNLESSSQTTESNEYVEKIDKKTSEENQSRSTENNGNSNNNPGAPQTNLGNQSKQGKSRDGRDSKDENQESTKNQKDLCSRTPCNSDKSSL